MTLTQGPSSTFLLACLTSGNGKGRRAHCEGQYPQLCVSTAATARSTSSASQGRPGGAGRTVQVPGPTHPLPRLMGFFLNILLMRVCTIQTVEHRNST